MMASSYMSFSLLAKGIGHVTKNGHEKLDVILEPEDYYNLQSTYESELNAFQRKPRDLDGQKVEEIPLHKTFITRKGALLLFSEDLAKKGQWEEATQRRKVRNKKELSWMTPFDASTLEHAGEDILKTCHDLSWAILSYGNKPEYRKRGEELYLRFVHQNNAGNKEQRKIRPGFSPKRYISTWSHQWDNDLVEKLISKGMIADKTLFTQNPHQLTGKFTNFNLSDRPTPYRVTQNMLVGSTTQPGYEFYSFGDSLGGDELKTSSTPPPSQDDTPRGDMEDIDDDEDVIQALKYHENGTIQQVEYSELQPKEKESILAELLVAAHEHQQNIRNTLTMISEDPSDGASESGSSKTELVMDMNEAIMSLIASPVKQQMMERKQLQQQQEEQEELDLLKKREMLVNERMKSSKEVDDKNDPDYGMTFSHTNKPSELEPITSRPSKKGPLKRGGIARKLEVSDEELMTSYMNEQAAGGTSEEPTSTKMAPPPYKEKKDSLTSSVNKPVLFQPPISMNDKPKYSSSNTSSKRRGAMPISSNIVRQTLAGNLSILSASTQHQPNYDIDVRNIAEQISVPLPSIPEPNRQHGKIPSPFSTLGNQPQHTSNNTGNLPPTRRDVDDDRPQNSDHPEQHRRQNQQDKIDGDQDDDRDDPDQIDPSALKSPLRGSTKSSQSSKLSQTRSRGLRTKLVPALPEKRYLHVEIPFHGMKGGRGPGSQSSSSLIKSNGEPKKTESRNVLPQMKKHHQQQHNYASVRMPDGEIMSIGGSITQSISTKDDSHHDYDYYNEDKSSTLLGSDERKRIIRSSNIKSEVSSSHEGGSSTKRRVSFMEERKVMEIGRHEDENDETHHSMSGSRPTSSVSSEKIIKHAKKVAAIVVNQQRPTSRLDDDARKAAQVWNEVIVSDNEEDDVNEDDETAADTHDDDDGDDFNEDEEGYLLKAANKNTSKRNSVRSLASNTSSHHRRADDDDDDEGSTSRQTLHVDLQDKFGAESESSAMSTARDDASSKYTANTKISVQAVDGSNSGTARKSDASAKGKSDLLKDLTSTKHEGNSPASKPSKSKKPASSKSKASSKSSESKKKHKRKEKKEQQQPTAAESAVADSPTFPVDSNTAEDSDFSPREDSKTRKEKKRSRKKDPETQVEKLLEGSDHSSKESDGNESKRKASGASTRTPSEAFPSPAQTPVDDYEFVRVEEEFEDEEEEEKGVMRERYDTKTDQILKPPGKRSPTAQEEDEDEGSVGGRSEESKAKMIAAKEERMAKRAAAADRRRMEVERKRREKDELQRKKQEEQERKEQMQEQLELERRQREEDLRKKKEEAELEKLKEQEEEEARKRRAEQQAEREKRMEEEKRKKREELQRKRKEEEEKRKEMLRIQEEEEAERKKQEEEMLAQMEEEERIQYQEKMKKEKEEKERLELERRLKEEEEVRKAMEYARKQAILKAHEQAILQQKLEFVRNMKDEGEKLTQAQKISRAYNFSYFELLRLLGMDMPA